MELHKRTVLSDIEKDHIDALVKLCNQHDATYTDIYLSNQFNYYLDLPAFFLAYEGETLIGVLNIYADEADEAEIKAMVHPERRRQGIFRFLLRAADEELRAKKYTVALYVVDRCFAGYEALMTALGGTYTEAEYYMVWQNPKLTAPAAAEVSSKRVRLAKEADIPVLAQIAAEAFAEELAVQLKYEAESLRDPEIYKFVIEQDGLIAGGCSVSVRPELNYIFGLCVAKARQHQGLGKALLGGVITHLQAEDRENIALSVVTDNENALKLYQNCGFVTKTANLYYKTEID